MFDRCAWVELFQLRWGWGDSTCIVDVVIVFQFNCWFVWAYRFSYGVLRVVTGRVWVCGLLFSVVSV